MNPQDFSPNAPGELVQIPEGAVAFVPGPLPLDIKLSLEAQTKLMDAVLALGRLDGLGEASPGAHLLAGPFLRREALLSSRIEGTISTMQQLLLFETDPEDAAASGDTREVAAYVAALQYGLEYLQEHQLSLWLIRELHAILMRDGRGSEPTPGKFRDRQNAIGREGDSYQSARYVPPPPHELERLLAGLEDYIAALQRPWFLAQLAIVHYQFEAIHPFMDGNGRVGRLMLMLLLAKSELLPRPFFYLSGYFDKYRSQYVDRLLAVSRHGEWENWIMFFLDAITAQANEAMARARSLLALQHDYHAAVRLQRSSTGLVQMIDLLFEWPAITARRAEARLGVSFPTARNNIRKLEELGILQESTGRERNRIYLAPNIINIVEAQEVG